MSIIFPAKGGRFNFLRGPLDPRFSFSRSGTALYVGENGLLQSAAVNTPRFEYDPSTGKPLGLLLEAAATNLSFQSQDLTQAVWAKNGCNVTSTSGIAPDGTATGCTISNDGVTATSYAEMRDAPVTNGSKYTGSAWLKAGSASQVFLADGFGNGDLASFTLTGAGAVTSQTSACLTASITSYPNGWYRCTVTALAAAAFWRPRVGSPTYNHAANTNSFSAWGVQLEAGPLASSYIATTAAAATRNLDACTMPLSSIPGFNAAEGSLLAEFISPTAINASGGNGVFSIDPGSGSDGLQVYFNGGTFVAAEVDRAGSIQAQLNCGALIAGTPSKIGLSWAAANFQAARDAVAQAPVLSGTPPSNLNTLRLGAANFGPAVGAKWLRQLTLFGRAMTTFDLQRMTQ